MEYYIDSIKNLKIRDKYGSQSIQALTVIQIKDKYGSQSIQALPSYK